MSLITLLVVLVVLCVVFYLLKAYVCPALPPPFGMLVLLVFALIVIVWLLSLIGVLPMSDIKIR